MDLRALKGEYYRGLDLRAADIAGDLGKKRAVTEKLLSTIIELYFSAKIEQDYKNPFFESAYHPAITSNLEFLISRILYHYSKLNDLDWHIFLRRQFKNTAPDIRIAIGKRSIGLIEIKAKAGWIQPFFSQRRYLADKDKLRSLRSTDDPDVTIKKLKDQIFKYQEEYSLSGKSVFFLLPTLIGVHRKESDVGIYEYRKFFSNNSGLSRNNLVLLSKNLTLDLSRHSKQDNLNPTEDFEKMIDSIRSSSILKASRK